MSPSIRSEIEIKKPSNEQKEGITLNSIVAGFARSSLIGLKFSLAWYFKSPIKLFRPAPFQPYKYLLDLHRRSKKNKIGYTGVLKAEYRTIISKTLPLLIINGSIGVVLFTMYTNVDAAIRKTYNSVSDHCLPWFISGGIAGFAQSLLATPLRGIESRLGSFKSRSSLKSSYIDQDLNNFKETYSSRVHKLKQMSFGSKNAFSGFLLNSIRDSIGFSFFFGVFESIERFGSTRIHQIFNNNFPQYDRTKKCAEALVLVSAGTLGGILHLLFIFTGVAYQLISYPFSRLNSMHKTPPRPSDLYNVLRVRGIAYLYRGVFRQLIRVVPPSALALCLYKVF